MAKLSWPFLRSHGQRAENSPLAILRATILLDAVWYRENHPDLRGSAIDAAKHYLEHGAKEGRNPHPLFDTRYYSARTPELEPGDNPLVHYLLRRSYHGARPHPLFDADFYISTAPDFARSGIDPLSHYLTVGWKQGGRPAKSFDPQSYLNQNPHVRALGIEPLGHYVQSGHVEQRYETPIVVDKSSDDRGQTIPVVDASREKPSASSVHETRPAPKERLTKAPRKVRDFHYEVWKAPANLEGRNVCLFAAYAEDNHLPRSTTYYIDALNEQGLEVVVVVASKNSGKPRADSELRCAGLISRDNAGYDFGSWALGLQILPSLWKANLVLVSNDSIFGPIEKSSLGAVIEQIERSSADYIGLTQSWQVKHHFQSYFFALKLGALANPNVRAFWNNLDALDDRDQVILNYEVPMLSLMHSFGLRTEVLFPLGDRDRDQEVNPTLDHWRELIEEGFPFIKVQTLRDDISGVAKDNWEAFVGSGGELRSVIVDRLSREQEQSRRRSIVRPHP